MPAAKPLTAHAAARSLITNSGLSMVQLKDWIFLVWEQLYLCVTWRKQANSVVHTELTFFS